MTSTIVRVKRRLEDDPVDALLLSFKRKKSDDAPSEQALLRLTATVEEKNDLATTKTIVKTKQDLRETYKSHIPDIVIKQRQEREIKQKESRFKILSLNRLVDSSEGSSNSQDAQAVSIVDVGPETEDTDLPTHEPKYVYDLYSSDKFQEADIDDGCLEILHSVQPFSFPMEYRGSEDSDEIDYCDEDSNDEDNYRNDYPDSDNSINEDDMRLAAALHGVGINDGDLSSDTEDELITSIDSNYAQHRSYESYKKSVLRTCGEDETDEINKLAAKYDGNYSISPDYSSSEDDGSG